MASQSKIRFRFFIGRKFQPPAAKDSDNDENENENSPVESENSSPESNNTRSAQPAESQAVYPNILHSEASTTSVNVVASSASVNEVPEKKPKVPSIFSAYNCFFLIDRK